MRNSILIAIFLMLVPRMASAQFYTITKEVEIKMIQASNKEIITDNKEDTSMSKDIKARKNITGSQPNDSAAIKQYTRNVDGKTSQKSEQIKPNVHLPKLTIHNLYTEIKRNGILYPKIVLAQAILETGWFTSPLCRDKHNLFGLTNPHTGKYYAFDHWSESVRAYYTKVQYKYKREDGNYLLWLKKIGYAEDPSYVQSVCHILNVYF